MGARGDDGAAGMALGGAPAPPVTGSASGNGGAAGGASGEPGAPAMLSGDAGSGVGGTADAQTDAGATAVEAGASSTADAAGDRFELLWEDSFDTLDLSRWELMTHSWEGNLAQFVAENATVDAGVLKLALSAATDDGIKPFRGVELRSRETFMYGRLEVSARFAAGSAVVSSIVTLYTPWPPPDWNELDIEFLGKNTREIQFNHMVNVPPADPETGHLEFPALVALGFNPAADFHTYAVEWVPGEARFYADGMLYHTATQEMQRMVLPQNILLTIWASAAENWAGSIDETTAPTHAEYDWLKLYAYAD